MPSLSQRTRLGTVTPVLAGSGSRNQLYWSGVPAPESVSPAQTYSYSFASLLGGSLASASVITNVGAALPTGWSLNSSARTLNYDGTGAASSASIILRATNGSVTADTTAFSVTVASAPVYTVTVENWSSGSAVNGGVIAFGTTALRTNQTFDDPLLAADCVGWDEYGPVDPNNLPVIGGVRFSAKLIDIKPGGIFPAGAKRIIVMQYADDLTAGMYGDSLLARTYAPPHKIVVRDSGGSIVETLQMHDGLPINDASFEQDLRPLITSTGATKPDKVVRPWVPVGAAYIFFIGAQPSASTALRNLIPRATSDWPTVRRSIGSRSTVRGTEWNYYHPDVDNGNAHPAVMPRWPLSKNQIDANTLVNNDPTLFWGGAYNWTAALVYGWDYEPGVYGGITRRGGDGGVRGDRTSFPPEFIGSWLLEPSGTRPHDGASYAEMAEAQIKNYANYPAYRPRDLADLRPVDVLSFPQSAPVPNGERHYFSQGYYSETNAHGAWSSLIKVVDEQTGATIPVSLLGARTTHPWAGWSPDSQHQVRFGPHYAVLLKADPMYSLMADFLATEGFTIANFIAGYFRYFNQTAIRNDPGDATFASRTIMLDFIQAVQAWKVATSSSVNSRAKIEAATRAWVVWMMDNLFAFVPPIGSETTAGHIGWNRYRNTLVWRDQTDFTYQGWCVYYGPPLMYVAEFLLLAKAWGFRVAVETGGTSTENAKVVQFFAWMEEHLRIAAEFFTRNPSCWAAPYLPLRSSAQGAVQSNLSTIPTSVTSAIANTPARSDWWNAPSGASWDTFSNNNTMSAWRMRCAQIYWQYIAPDDATRTTQLANLAAAKAGVAAAIQAGGGLSGYFRYAWTQDLPALN